MKILLIFPLCPLPTHSGGQVRVWNIATQLAKKHEVSLLCFIRDEKEKKYEHELLTVFHSVTFIQRKKLFDRSALLGGWGKFLSFINQNLSILLAALFSGRPFISHLYDSSSLRDHIQMVDAEGKYDLLYAETFYGISSLKDILTELKTPLLLIDQNIESIAYDRQSAHQKSMLIRMLMRLDVLKMKREEEFFWKTAPLLGALSEPDKAYISARTSKPVLLLENGVDVHHFSERITSRVTNELLFVGTFSYFQNVDSLQWFISDIWPKIQSENNGNITLRIVGRRADASLKKFVASHSLVIDEGVEDIREAFQRATVLVAPIRAGSGTKYKILEALASHLPVVTTVIGAEGLHVISGDHLLLADTATQFATASLQLLRDESVRLRLADKGYSYVASAYDWNALVSSFEGELITALKNRS